MTKKCIYQRYNVSLNIQQNKDIKYVSLQYIKGSSEQINKVVSKHNIVVAHKEKTPTKNLFSKLKPDISLNEKANVVFILWHL